MSTNTYDRARCRVPGCSAAPGVPLGAVEAVVLRLPEVPAGAVALIDHEGQRWTLSDYTTTSGQPIWICPTRERIRTYAALLDLYGPLRVELADREAHLD